MNKHSASLCIRAILVAKQAKKFSVVVLLTLGASSAHAGNARPADSLVDSIGVNVHFDFAGVYQNPNARSKLGESGIRYIRDRGANTFCADVYTTFGIKTLAAVDYSSGTVADRVAILNQSHVIAIEGFNEPEVWPRTWNGLSDLVSDMDFCGTRAFQRDLYDGSKATISTRLKPVVSPPLAWWINNRAVTPVPFDKVGIHPYQSGNFPGISQLDSECMPDAAQAAVVGQSQKPIWATECGYHNAMNYSGYNPRPISEAVGGKYIPRMIACNYMRGIEKSFIYELVDVGTSTSNTIDRFGLLRNNFSEKPAFWGIKNLISLLQDSGPSFTPGALNYTVSGGTADLQQILLQKRNGDYYLLLWQEVASSNPTPIPPTDLTVAPVNVSISFPSAAVSTVIYSQLDEQSVTISGVQTNVAAITVAVPDEIVIVKISGAASGVSGAPLPAAGIDLAFERVWSVPAEPVANEPVTLFAKIKNQGSVNANANTVRFYLDGNSWASFSGSCPAIPAGASATVTSGTWTPQLSGTANDNGFHNFRLRLDGDDVVPETNERNNMHCLTLPVPSNRLVDSCDSLASWTAINWTLGSRNGFTYFINNSQFASGSLTRNFAAALTTNWKLEFSYDWMWAGPIYNQDVKADMLDANNNGYRILVRHGDSDNPVYTARQVEIYKVTTGTAAGTPLGSGIGYDQPGNSGAPIFKRICLVYDCASQALSAYIDFNSDGVLEQVVAPVRDLISPTRSFNKLVLSANDGLGTSCKPEFDSIKLTSGMLDQVPGIYFSDNMDDPNLANWSAVTNWITYAHPSGKTYVHNTNQFAGGSMTRTFPGGMAKGWNLEFEYDWRWGGGNSGLLYYGFSQLKIHADMLDNNGNGYRLVVRQGDQGNTANTPNILEIYKVVNGTLGSRIGNGGGYNIRGWNPAGNPDFKRIGFHYNRAEQTLSAYVDVNGDGVMEQAVAPVQDLTTTTFNKLILSASDGIGGTCTPAVDNVRVGLIQ